jgi:hypothetical protein
MAYQAPFRVEQLERNAHRIRVARDPVMNDPTRTPDVKAFRAERLKSPLMARDHDQNITGSDGVRVLREAVAQDDDDTFHFIGSK